MNRPADRPFPHRVRMHPWALAHQGVRHRLGDILLVLLTWSFCPGRIFGIRLEIHGSYLPVVLQTLWTGWSLDGWKGGGMFAWFLLVGLATLILHEFGHVWAAQKFGVSVHRIVVFFGGAFAELEEMPRSPQRELFIALAGPAVNFLVVLGLLPFTGLPASRADLRLLLDDHTLVSTVLFINLLMGCFNLLPVFPLDGGRVLRALLATCQPYDRATWWAATLGKIIAVPAGSYAACGLHSYRWGFIFTLLVIAGEFEYRMAKQLGQTWHQPDPRIKYSFGGG